MQESRTSIIKAVMASVVTLVGLIFFFIVVESERNKYERSGREKLRKDHEEKIELQKSFLNTQLSNLSNKINDANKLNTQLKNNTIKSEGDYQRDFNQWVSTFINSKIHFANLGKHGEKHIWFYFSVGDSLQKSEADGITYYKVNVAVLFSDKSEYITGDMYLIPMVGKPNLGLISIYGTDNAFKIILNTPYQLNPNSTIEFKAQSSDSILRGQARLSTPGQRLQLNTMSKTGVEYNTIRDGVPLYSGPGRGFPVVAKFNGFADFYTQAPSVTDTSGIKWYRLRHAENNIEGWAALEAESKNWREGGTFNDLGGFLGSISTVKVGGRTIHKAEPERAGDELGNLFGF